MHTQHPFNWTCKCGHFNNDFFSPSLGPFVSASCDSCGAATDIAALSSVDQASYNAAYDHYAKNPSLPTLSQALSRIKAINNKYDAHFGNRFWVNTDLPDVPGGSADLDKLIELQEIVDADKYGRKVNTTLLRVQE